MVHPSDTEAWKEFNCVHLNFASDPRNIRLGLCTDGFCPFDKSSNTYSCWSVIVIVYNLPPWKCMTRPFMFLTMINHIPVRIIVVIYISMHIANTRS
jgi:hypothetical protein